jgi:hypothetical protein
MKLLLAAVIFAIGWLALTAPTYDQLYQPWALMGELVAIAIGGVVLVVGVFAAVYGKRDTDSLFCLLVTAVAILWASHVEAADKKLHPAVAGHAPTQSECMAAYMASCSSVPFTETAIRACIVAHKPECLELIRGIK